MKTLDKILLIIGNLLIIIGLGSTVFAQSLQSTNFRIDESYIGPGGGTNSTSAHFTEAGTVGDLGVGNSSSTNYQSNSGFNTTNDPRLRLVISGSSVSFGQFSIGSTVHSTATFNVLNYTSSGYSVFIVGNSPSNGSHNLTGVNPTDTSHTGTEQFGINLKANTSPASFGADPAQVPSGSFSYGAASSGYNTANNYRYVNGEKIAESIKTSGETDYTISYIINVASTTPGGKYSGNQVLVVVGAY